MKIYFKGMEAIKHTVPNTSPQLLWVELVQVLLGREIAWRRLPQLNTIKT
jgi:hypothetical protein